MTVTGSEYKKQQDATGYVFSVTPAKAPKFLLMTIGGAVLALLGLVLGPLGWLFFLPVGIFGIWIGYFRDGRPPAHRDLSSFRVSPTAIEANGRTFPKEDIHRLIIKNGVTNDVVGAPNVVIPVNTSTGSHTGRKYRRSPTRWRLRQAARAISSPAGWTRPRRLACFTT